MQTPAVIGDILMGRNPTMDLHPILWGVAIPLGMLHAKVPGISSGRLGLWLVCAFTPVICDSLLTK